MKKLVIIFLIFSFLSLQLTGCETMGWTEKGAITGAAGGAIIGAILGKGKGAAIGALAGAVVGAVVGHYYDRQVMARAEATKKYNYTGREEKLEINDSAVRPLEVAQGTSAEATTLYTVLRPDERQGVRITEIRTIVNGKERLELAQRDVVRSQGSHLSTMKFTIPKDIDKGDYNLITTISDGRQTTSSTAPMRIV